MKYIILSLCLVSGVAFSQAPEAFKYQGVLQADGQPVESENINVRISILSGSVTGTTVYSETHAAQTADNGAFTVDIGKGTVVSGAFANIDWSVNTYFVKIEIDADKNGTFDNAGTSQLVSVPYALYAKKSGDEKWNTTEGGIHYSAGKVGIGTSTPQEMLHVNGSIRGNQNGALRINTGFGYLDAGPINSDYAHFYTGQPYGFYFGGNVTVREHLIGYRESDFHISTQSFSTYQPVKRISILNSNGYVGVGKTNPSYQLDVNGAVNATSILVNGVPINPSGAGPWLTNNTDTYYSSGNVGIGTNTPQEALHINGNIRGNQSGATRFQSQFGYIDVGPKNADYGHFYTNMPYGFYFGEKVTVREQLIGYHLFDLHLSTQSAFDYQPVKRISILNANGNVGVGTESPKSKLEVQAGDVYLNTVGTGVIMKSPNGSCWRMTVSDTGTPVFTAIACPQ